MLKLSGGFCAVGCKFAVVRRFINPNPVPATDFCCDGGCPRTHERVEHQFGGCGFDTPLSQLDGEWSRMGIVGFLRNLPHVPNGVRSRSKLEGWFANQVYRSEETT